jgi:hypothetical protein
MIPDVHALTFNPMENIQPANTPPPAHLVAGEISAPRFRAKYGIADRWREWRSGRDTVPVRLETR